jgi:capsular exopolysaccharide synthesis family protein
MLIPLTPGHDHSNGVQIAFVPSDRVMDNRISSDKEGSLKDIWLVLRKRKWWIFSFCLGGIALAVLACIVLTNQYSSTATVQVGKDETVEVQLSSNAGPSLSESDVKTDIATHMAVLQSDSTALAVIDKLHLESYKPFAFKPTLLGWITGSNRRIENELNQHLPLSESPARRERLLAIFAKKLTVKNPPDTRLITVTFLNPNPQLAARIANALVDEYVKFESESRSSREATQWLETQLQELKQKMDDSQQALSDYERETGLNSLLLNSIGASGGAGAVTHIPVLDKLDALNQELTQAEANRVAKEAIYHLTQTKDSNIVADLASSSLPQIATSSAITQGNGLELLQNLRQQKAQLELAYSDASTKYGARNPRILELQSQLANVNKQIADELEQINLRARNDYALALKNEEGLRAAFAAQQAAASKLNESTVKLQMLAQQASSSRQLYEALYGQLQEANVQAGLRATNIKIADSARPSATPARPNPPLYVAIGLAAGMLFGVSTAFLREHMDETVRTHLQLQPLTRLPVLASVPRVHDSLPEQKSERGFLPKRIGKTSPLLAKPKSALAESYRTLRTSIALAAAGRPLHTLLVTSPLAGEGKTSVSYNVAIAFACAGKKVLLVDADLRHPQLHEYFNCSQSPGLSEVLADDKPSAALIQPHPTVRNLFLLPAGEASAATSELLGSAKLDDLLSVLKQSYGLIIIDSAPVLLTADAVALAAKVDATLGVVRAGVTNKVAVERAASVLERASSRAMGFVLNGVNTDSVEYYTAYGHNGGGKYYEEN